MCRRGPSPIRSPQEGAGVWCGGGGGGGDLSEDLTDGKGVAFEVVAAR